MCVCVCVNGMLFECISVFVYVHMDSYRLAIGLWKSDLTDKMKRCFFQVAVVHPYSIYGCPHHHHHVALVARISLTLSRHSFLSFIALGRSSGQHPVSSHSCWMYVRAGRPAFARPCVGVHERTSLMSSSLLLQQCPACLVRLTWIVRGQVAVELVSCGVLPLGLVQDCT